MGAERHYMMVNPAGDICLVYRATGSISDKPFPIMMRDEWGKFLPYTEKGKINHGCVPVDLNSSSELFTRVMISQEQFSIVGHPHFFCYFYDKRKREIALRPGHVREKVDTGQWGVRAEDKVDVAYPSDLERCNIAYGGRPIYWIKQNSEKSHTDFPELTAQGCLHPLKYQPRRM